MVIRLLLAKGYSDEIWNELVRVNPDLATRLSYARIHARSEIGACGISRNLAQQPRDEGWFQEFFEMNTWIFGYGLNYQILTTVQSRTAVRWHCRNGQGDRKREIFCKERKLKSNSQCLVEIKKPNTQLLGNHVVQKRSLGTR